MKPSKRPAGPVLYWHPNFRVAATLPDTKVIRTSFLINAAAVVVALGVGALVIRQEGELRAVREQNAEWVATAERHRERATQASALQAQFADGEKKLRQIEGFLAPRLVASDFLRLIAETLPRLIVIDQVELYDEGVRLRGTAYGSSASVPKTYSDQLAATPAIMELMESVRLSSQNRDQAGNRFTFAIELKLKGGKPAAPAPKRAPTPKPEALNE